MRGKLIVIDGGDGSGKATQTELLLARIGNQGFAVQKLDFPQYGTKSAYFVEEYLNGIYGGANDVSPKLASLFYALDRFDAKKRITESLQNGKIIISNRYVSSNAGHQGGKIKDKKKRQGFLSWLYDLEYEVCGLPKPDLTIYLHVPWKTGQLLVDAKGYRDYVGGQKRDIHEKDSSHLKNAQESYLYLAEKEEGWVKIDCEVKGKLLSKEEIHEKIYGEVKKRILS